MKSFWSNLGRSALEAAFPRSCLGCGGPPPPEGEFCPECLADTPFLRELESCDWSAPTEALDQIRALAWYGGPLAGPLRDFKYRRHYAKGVGLARLIKGLTRPEWLGEVELAAPVPLHSLRLIKRGFNQSAVLFRPLVSHLGLAFEPRLLVRGRRTRPQARLGRDDRLRNVAGAFRVGKGRDDLVRGRTILLVDDVFTTGATLGECAGALKRAGARKVLALVLARARPVGGTGGEEGMHPDWEAA